MFIRFMMHAFHGIMEVFLIGIAGYIIVAGIKQRTSYLDFLKKMVIRIALPCLVFSNMVTKFDPGEVPYWWVFPLLAVAVNISGALLAGGYLLADRTVKCRGEFMALVTFQNGIFLPLAFAPVIFGPEKLPEFLNLLFLFNLLNIPVFFTAAVWMVNSTAGIGFRLKDAFSPPIVATIVSFFIASFGMSASVPGWILRTSEMLGSLTSPLSILFLGGIIVTNLTRVKPEDWIEPLKITLLKCLVFPLIASFLVIVLRPPEHIALFIILQSAMPSATLTALIAPDRGANQKLIAGAIVFTMLTCIITLPIFMGLYWALYR